MIIPLIQLSEAHFPVAGGKACALARLAQAGFPVPAGLVILPAAFAGQALTAAAWAQVQARLADWRQRRSDVTFAVRSSGLSEDSAQAAYAGQFVSLLNLVTDEAIRQAIHTVYASRQSVQAAAYRQSRRLSGSLEMAVIVQELIPADCAGVCFSVDPVRRRRDVIVVNAAWGMGAGVMEGTITADTAWVYRHDFSLEKQQIVPKPVQLVPNPDGGVQQASVPSLRHRAACLPSAWLTRISQFSLAVELMAGSAQEVEWAIAGEQVWLLQSRPLTSLPPELTQTPPFPVAWADEAERGHLWRLADYSRGVAPPLPLEHDYMAVRESVREETCRFLGTERNQTTRIWQGRPYVRAVPLGLSEADKRVRQAALEDWQQRLQGQGLTTWDHWGPEVIRAVKRLRAFDVAAALVSGEAAALADHLDEALAVTRRNNFIHPCVSFKPKRPYFEAFATLTGLAGAEAETAAYQLLDSDENMLTRLIDGLYELAQLAGQDETIAGLVADPPPDVMVRLAALPLAGRLRAQLTSFLAEFGERTGEGYGSEMTILTPTWREEPTRLLRLIAIYMDPEREAPAALRARARAAQDAQVAALVNGHPDEAAVAEFQRQLTYARQNLTALEDHNHWIEQASGGLLRQAIMASAQQMVQAGILAVPEDIFWLTFAEILAALRATEPDSLAETVADRRAQQSAWARLTPPPILGVPPARLPPRPPPVDKVVDNKIVDEVVEDDQFEVPGTGQLQGIGASPGQVEGRAHIVQDSALLPVLSPGDVLVAPNAGPLWTPLFPTLGGLVLESGSLGQHAAVTAREYGIPAVIACRLATKCIPDGATIQIDGQAGLVTIVAFELSREPE